MLGNRIEYERGWNLNNMFVRIRKRIRMDKMSESMSAKSIMRCLPAMRWRLGMHGKNTLPAPKYPLGFLFIGDKYLRLVT